MKQLIANYIPISCDEVDFTTSTDIVVWIKQGSLFFRYTPTVVDAHNIVVEMPFADAKQLTISGAKVQWALTDANGQPVASDPVMVSVGEILDKDGYDPH